MVKRYYNATIAVSEEKHVAKAMGIGINASLKVCTEICNNIKGKSAVKTKQFLLDVMEHKRFIPLKRYHKKVGHRKGDSVDGQKAGRYADNTVKAFLKVFDNALANADYKGLDEEKLVVSHATANQAFGRMSFQNKGKIGGKGRKKKTCHVEIILTESR